MLPRCIRTTRGVMHVERDYIPGVVDCEMGGFRRAEAALAAQAIAARTYLARFLERKGHETTVPIGARFQCWKRAKHAGSVAAALETEGTVMRHEGLLLSANYVSGARKRHPDCTPKGPRENGYRYNDWAVVRDIYLECRRKKRRRPFKGVSWTEVVVTHNEGLSGDAVQPTPMGSRRPRNRGAMSQYGAACLARQDFSTEQILRYYYGEDLVLSGASSMEMVAGEPLEGVLPELVIPTVPEHELGLDSLEDVPERLPSIGVDPRPPERI